MAGLAAHTHSVTLGTAVLLAPFYHPFHIAEDATMLDVISGGRCVVGLGVGRREEEFRLFNVPIKERGGRTEESVRILRALWAEDRVTYDGKYFSLQDARLLPKPIQRPRPPIWMGGWTEPACARAARWAAARERLYHNYKDDYIQWGHTTTPTGEAEVTFEGLMKDRFIIGPPEKCIEGLEKFVDELGVNHLIFRMHFHDMPQRAVLDSMELFAVECMPHLKKKYG